MRRSVIPPTDNSLFRCTRPKRYSAVATGATEQLLSVSGQVDTPSRLQVRLRLRPTLSACGLTAPASMPGPTGGLVAPRAVPPLRGWCRPSGAGAAPLGLSPPHVNLQHVPRRWIAHESSSTLWRHGPCDPYATTTAAHAADLGTVTGPRQSPPNTRGAG